MKTTTRLLTGLLFAMASTAALAAGANPHGAATSTKSPAAVTRTADYMTMQDGTRIYYKDWGHGQPIVFSHGWPLDSDSWEAQMMFLADHGYRVIAHDRRGHGRSSQPWEGNDMDHYADDLATVIETLAATVPAACARWCW